jgi:hypothetical protein
VATSRHVKQKLKFLKKEAEKREAKEAKGLVYSGLFGPHHFDMWMDGHFCAVHGVVLSRIITELP